MNFNDEVSALKNYFKNWRALVMSAAISLFLYLILSGFKIKIQSLVKHILDFSPNLVLFTLLLTSITMLNYTRIVLLFERYRNSHFIKVSSLQLIDLLLFPIISGLVWIYRNHKIFQFPVYIKLTFIFSIVLFLLSYFHGVVKSILFRNKVQKKDYELIPLLSDEPIHHETKDLLGRVKFVRTIKSQIYELLALSEPFVIGLYAPWGEGKTSIINLLKKETTKDNKLLIYEFNPCYFDKEKTIIVNFFRGLEDLLKKHYHYPVKLKNIFKSYLQILLKGEKSFNLNFDIQNNPVDLRKEIERFISKLDKKILIIIDDIDRLQPLEILTIFRLVRQISHIENTIFLLSLDYKQIILALEKGGYINNAKNYIEKIIQLPLQIPLVDQNKINNFLLFSNTDKTHVSEIDKLFNKLEINSEKIKKFDEDFPTFYQSCLHQLFSNIRSVKRYLNNLIVKLPPVKDEVNLYDFFILEILDTFFPEVYSDIKENLHIYFSPWGPEYGTTYYLEKEKRYENIKNHIENITPTDDTILVSNILSNIFPEIRRAFNNSYIKEMSFNYNNSEIENYRINQRIAHPDCGKKYFMLDTLEQDISDKELFGLIDKWKKSNIPEQTISDDFFNNFKKNSKLLTLLQRLKLYSKNLDKKLSLLIINVISNNCQKFYHSPSFFIDDEYRQAIGLIFTLLENKSLQDINIFETVKDIICNNKDFSFLSNFLFSCRLEIERNPKIRKILIFEELKNILKSRLVKHFIIEKRDIFYEYPEDIDFQRLLYSWSIDWDDKGLQYDNQVSIYLVENFKKNPKNCSRFLKGDIRIKNGRKKIDCSQFEKAFNIKIILDCVEELGEKSYSSPNEKEIIDLFLESGKTAKSTMTL